MGKTITFRRPDGQTVPGYLAEPANPTGAPGMVVIRAWGGVDFGEADSQDITGAVRWLESSGAKVGVTGFCMSGALTLLASCFVPEVDAAVTRYGFPSLDLSTPRKSRRRCSPTGPHRIRPLRSPASACWNPGGARPARTPSTATSRSTALPTRQRLAQGASPAPSTTRCGRSRHGTAACASSAACWAEPESTDHSRGLRADAPRAVVCGGPLPGARTSSPGIRLEDG